MPLFPIGNPIFIVTEGEGVDTDYDVLEWRNATSGRALGLQFRYTSSANDPNAKHCAEKMEQLKHLDFDIRVCYKGTRISHKRKSQYQSQQKI